MLTFVSVTVILQTSSMFENKHFANDECPTSSPGFSTANRAILHLHVCLGIQPVDAAGGVEPAAQVYEFFQTYKKIEN